MVHPSGTAHFEFVQLKEVVPHELNPHANLQEVLDRLFERYSRAGNMTVAVNLNQSTTTDFATLRLPDLQGARLWLYGLGEGDGCDSFLIGDLLAPPAVRAHFNYPILAVGESPARWSSLLDD